VNDTARLDDVEGKVGRVHAETARLDACDENDIANALRRLPAFLLHATLGGNAARIKQEGLHCASALIKAAERDHPGYQAPHYRHRTLILPNGTALRDQRPMAPELLVRCLDPTLSVTDWYGLVNARVFFWIDAARLPSYLQASAGSEQVVYTVDTQSFVRRYADCMEVTPFNVGYAKRRGAARGLRTFVSLKDWSRSGWATEKAAGRKPRAATAGPVELAVCGSIPDFHQYVTAQRVVPASR
jgi:hypothetical protein